MASAGANPFKSPKTPRRPKTPESRQVHFEPEAKPAAVSSSSSSGGFNTENITGYTTANSPNGGFSAGVNGVKPPKTPPGIKTTTTAARTSTPAPEKKVDTQPTNFPALGLGANQLQWHVSANPTQSLSYQLPTSFISPPPQAQQHQFFPLTLPQFHPSPFIGAGPNNITPSPTPTPITYIGVGPQSPALNFNQASNMGDYQNAAPPVNGLHFQPPVPDTTFGPMQHVYVPRHDGGFAGLQVGAPAPFNYVSAAPFAFVPAPLAASSASYTTVVVPKTFYLNGYTYYASLLCWFTHLVISFVRSSPESSGSVPFHCIVMWRVVVSSLFFFNSHRFHHQILTSLTAASCRYYGSPA